MRGNKKPKLIFGIRRFNKDYILQNSDSLELFFFQNKLLFFQKKFDRRV